MSKVLADVTGNLEELTGLSFDPTPPGITTSSGVSSFEVHSVRPARRRGPGGEEVNQVVMAITQRRHLEIDGETVEFPGGCTLILDLETLELRYAISKPIADPTRERQFRDLDG